MHRLRVEYFFDLTCPYSWIGFRSLLSKQRLMSWKDVEIELTPVRRGKILAVAGNPSLLMFPPLKLEYIFSELKILGKMHGVSISKPKDLESICSHKSVRPLLFLLVVREKFPSLFERVAEIMWSRIWSYDLPMFRTPFFFKVCREVGLQFRETDELISGIELRSNVNKLESSTGRAISFGAFDTPWILVTDDTGRSLSVHNIFHLHKIYSIIENRELFDEWKVDLEERNRVTTLFDALKKTGMKSSRWENLNQNT
ncbi:hypothetical protein AB6A40_003430 [Gnathostoma spinigerum]|uniref:DSBA-like thioredoxin domain-containing protein n=1 Tax=Gnathostoma spinigerum TaxID=75299 RepID=A0ABD6EH55_9BILA